LPLELPAPLPLKARELLERRPLAQRLAAPVGGVLALGLVAGLGLLMPEPKPAVVPPPSPSQAQRSSP
jgi:hypothetical protein